LISPRKNKVGFGKKFKNKNEEFFIKIVFFYRGGKSEIALCEKNKINIKQQPFCLFLFQIWLIKTKGHSKNNLALISTANSSLVSPRRTRFAGTVTLAWDSKLHVRQ